jgi:hypothetical protein
MSLSIIPFGFATTACGDGADADGDSPCTPDDQDGVIGGKYTVLVSVSDTEFSVGGVGSGSTQRNITIQNSSEATLTLTNTGTKPHSFVVECIPSGLPPGCEQTSCFPAEANIAPIDPGTSKTTTFEVPVVEGAYPVSSDVAGDDALVGQFIVN